MLANDGGRAMASNKKFELVRRIYDNVEAALWASLLAFVIYFVAFDVPNLPAYWAQAERIRAEEIAMENTSYCEKLGMTAGAPKHEQCLLTLGEFRLKVETRIAAEQDF